MSDVVRCYYCGREIENEENITMKTVSMGLFRVERKPFHTECWRKYHGVQLKKNVLMATFIIGVFLLTIITSFFLFSGTVGHTTGILYLFFLIGLLVAYFSVKE